jgi:HAD superfamily hydrolase (TIGR01509 family)
MVPETRSPIPPGLIANVRLLSLDAGNTIVFLDHEAMADAAAAAGFALDRGRLPAAEGAAKRALGDGSALPAALPDPDIPPTWSTFVAAIMLAAGLGPDRVADCTRAVWRAHRRQNLWRRIPEDLAAAITQLRARGVPVCVVSNSEGQLAEVFAELGIAHLFDLIVDSQAVGVEKPDPAIFAHALAHFGLPAAEVLHLGDVIATDVVGARAAGIRAGLIDPMDHYGRYVGPHADVPRVPSAAAVARAIAKLPSAQSSG